MIWILWICGVIVGVLRITVGLMGWKGSVVDTFCLSVFYVVLILLTYDDIRSRRSR